MTAAGFAGRHHSLVEFALLVVIFATASMMGDSINYWFGAWVIRQVDKIPWVARHLNGDFAEKVSKNLNPRRWLLFIVIGRFVPFIRTIVPLSAHRLHLRFQTYFRMSVIASLLWAVTMVTIGYYFGHLELPKWVMAVIIIVVVAFVVIVIRSPRFRELILSLITKPSRELENEED